MSINKLISIFLLITIIIASGCSYVDKSKILEGTVDGKDTHNFYHINAGNGGIFLFSLPVISGNPFGKWPVFFRNNVNAHSVTEMIVSDAFIHNGKVVIKQAI